MIQKPDDKFKIVLNGQEFHPFINSLRYDYEIQTVSVPNISMNAVSNLIRTKNQETVELGFDVVSNNYNELIDNFKKLRNILDSLKPPYIKIQDQVIPHYTNFLGYSRIQFSGLNPDGNRSKININITNFSYEINRDLGFRLVPWVYITRSSEVRKNHTTAKNKLIPIGYSINIKGIVSIPFAEAVNLK